MYITVTRVTPACCVMLLGTLLGGYVTTASANNALLGMLTSQLGINEQQASTGIGALMDMAKQHLSGTDYARLLSGAPDLGTTAAAPTAPAAQAPKTAGGTDWLGHVGTWMGTPKLGQMAQLTQTLVGLGLTSDMIGTFLKITLDYVQSKGGPSLMGLLAGALKF